MGKLHVKGNKYLQGEVNISGAKNSALPIMVASILCRGTVTLYNIPKIADVYDMIKILNTLNVKTVFTKTKLIIDSSQVTYKKIDQALLDKIRASYYLMGAFLAVFNKADIITPGGCKIGERPIDFHLMAFKKLGALEDKNHLTISEYKKATIFFKKKSVGASINALLASVGNPYQTAINNISLEPEVLDVINFLQKMGVNIKQIRNRVIIFGTKQIKKNIAYKIIPDRIETATYLFLGLLCGHIRINNVYPSHLTEVLDVVAKSGGKIIVGSNYIIASKSRLKASNLVIAEYPAFPTDIQPLIFPLLALSTGTGYVMDDIFENRFKACIMLNKMGASIDIDRHVAAYEGVETLYGAEIKAFDLRCAAALLIAALSAKGETVIDNINYIERGYSDIYRTIQRLGGNIFLEE